MPIYYHHVLRKLSKSRREQMLEWIPVDSSWVMLTSFVGISSLGIIINVPRFVFVTLILLWWSARQPGPRFHPCDSARFPQDTNYQARMTLMSQRRSEYIEKRILFISSWFHGNVKEGNLIRWAFDVICKKNFFFNLQYLIGNVFYVYEMFGF